MSNITFREVIFIKFLTSYYFGFIQKLIGKMMNNFLSIQINFQFESNGKYFSFDICTWLKTNLHFNSILTVYLKFHVYTVQLHNFGLLIVKDCNLKAIHKWHTLPYSNQIFDCKRSSIDTSWIMKTCTSVAISRI